MISLHHYNTHSYSSFSFCPVAAATPPQTTSESTTSFESSVYSISKALMEEREASEFKESKTVLENPNAVHSEQLACGEDAFFISKNSNGFCRSLGIADGVGGWSNTCYNKINFDSADVANTLMKKVEKLCQSKGSSNTIYPKDLLIQAYYELVHEKCTKYGSTTACVLSLNYEHKLGGSQDATLSAVNIGDSGFLVLRQAEDGSLVVVHHTNPQQHATNCPFQLAVLPNDFQKCSSKKYIDDKPSVAESYSFRVQTGDIIVLASDGLFDNLFERDITKIVEKELKNANPTEETQQKMFKIAKALCTAAAEKAVDKCADTPFSRANGVNFYKGGKIDDTTVIVSTITSKSPSPKKQSQTTMPSATSSYCHSSSNHFAPPTSFLSKNSIEHSTNLFMQQHFHSYSSHM